MTTFLLAFTTIFSLINLILTQKHLKDARKFNEEFDQFQLRFDSFRVRFNFMNGPESQVKTEKDNKHYVGFYK